MLGSVGKGISGGLFRLVGGAACPALMIHEKGWRQVLTVVNVSVVLTGSNTERERERERERESGR